MSVVYESQVVSQMIFTRQEALKFYSSARKRKSPQLGCSIGKSPVISFLIKKKYQPTLLPKKGSPTFEFPPQRRAPLALSTQQTTST